MAAGMGSRYGGLKQIDPVDDLGNLIIDFSIYDAWKAGFKKIIFIIKKEIEQEFKDRIGNRIGDFLNVEYVYQELDHLPAGHIVPPGRKKPWGTGHAILCCMDKIDGPFAVINADDYYGKEAFKMIYGALTTAQDDVKYRYTMVGYLLENTLTDHGYVARGVCEMNGAGKLIGIQERTHIEKRGQEAAYTEDEGKTWATLSGEATVSMNLWGFTNSIFAELNNRFQVFLEKAVLENPLKCEYFLPEVVGELLKENKAEITVLPSKDKWYGVTYKEDKKTVVNAIKEFRARGLYPDRLWI